MLPALDLDPVSEPAAAISRDAWRPSLPVPSGRRAGTGPARSRPARTSLSGMASTRRASSRARLVLRSDNGSLRRSSPSLTSMSKRRTRPHALPSNRTFDSASSEAIPGKPSRIVIEACCDQIRRLHTKSIFERRRTGQAPKRAWPPAVDTPPQAHLMRAGASSIVRQADVDHGLPSVIVLMVT